MTNRSLLGRKNDGAYGFYVSAPGVNVDAATLPEQFLFNSDLAQGAVVHASGVLTPGATASFPALPYAPIVMSWGIDRSNGRQSGRTVQRAGYTYSWWDPGLSEYSYEYYTSGVYGPILETTPRSVHYPDQGNVNNFAFGKTYNARYVVLRVGA